MNTLNIYIYINFQEEINFFSKIVKYEGGFGRNYDKNIINDIYLSEQNITLQHNLHWNWFICSSEIAEYNNCLELRLMVTYSTDYFTNT